MSKPKLLFIFDFVISKYIDKLFMNIFNNVMFQRYQATSADILTTIRIDHEINACFSYTASLHQRVKNTIFVA